MSEFLTLLRSNQNEIITEWVSRVLDIPDSHFQQYSSEKVTQWVSQGLDVIIQSLVSGSKDALDAYINVIATTRLHRGFPIYDVTESLLLAKEVIFPILIKSYPPDTPEIIDAISQLNICLRYLIRGFEYSFSVAMHNQLVEKTNQRLIESESIQKTMMALLQKLTLDEVLEIVCSEARQLTNAEGSAVLILEGKWLWVTSSIGNLPPAVDKLAVEESLSGFAVKQKKPILVNDPSREAKVNCWHPDLQSLLVIPLCVEETVIGVINVINKPAGFNNDDIRIMNLFADQSAIAIKNARLYQQSEQLAVVKERQRLARDLHDTVTQTIYSISLYAEATRKALQGDKKDRALENLWELRKMIREVTLEMRLLIFELHPPVLQKDGLVTALRTRLEAVEARSGMRTEYHVTGERRLSLETETELYRIAQETLTNVVKHAQANHISVSLHYDETKFRFKVHDNGVGFNLEKASTCGGVGLRNILERTQRMNGKLSVESSHDRGTTIEVSIEI
jgi:signal transduction histidine kinase